MKREREAAAKRLAELTPGEPGAVLINVGRFARAYDEIRTQQLAFGRRVLEVILSTDHALRPYLFDALGRDPALERLVDEEGEGTAAQQAASVPSLEGIEIRDEMGQILAPTHLCTVKRDSEEILVVTVGEPEGEARARELLCNRDRCPDCGVAQLEFHRPGCPQLPPTGLQVIR